MNLRINIILLLLLCFAFKVNCQKTWRSSLYPSNWKSSDNKKFYSDKLLQDWSYAGYRRGENPIPNINKNILDVTKAPYHVDKSGKKDATAAIQKAINDAGSRGGGVVYLPAGTYRVSLQKNKNYALAINHSKVVFRGEGKNKTFIFNESTQMRNKAVFLIRSNSSWTSGTNATKITKDLTTPTKIIPVSNPSNYNKGDIIIVRNHIGKSWVEEHKAGKIWNNTNALKRLNGVMYCREVMSVDKNKKTITIDIPTRYTLLRRDNSEIYKIKSMISEIGLENFSIGNKEITKIGWSRYDYNTPGKAAFDAHSSELIKIERIRNSWIKNVSSYAVKENRSKAHMLSNGIQLEQCKNMTVSGCYMGYPQFGWDGGNGYMFSNSSNEVLIENSIAGLNRHGFVFSYTTASGNVIHRCEDRDTQQQVGDGKISKVNGAGSDHHQFFSHSNLIDQCTVKNSFFASIYRPFADPIHGVAGAHTAYWNTESNGNQSYAVESQQGRYGYVIGTSGNKSNVNLNGHPGIKDEQKRDGRIMTAPLDHVEGKGKGNTLVPASLYLDQRNKRFKGGGNPPPPVENKKPNVSFKSLSNIITVEEGYRLTVVVNASDPDGTISSVSLFNGANLIRVENNAPYEWGHTGSPNPNELNGLKPGVYTIKAVAKDNKGAVSSTSIKLKVKKKPNVLPQVRIISPTKDISVDTGYQLGVKAEASDSDGSIRGVKLYIGSRMIREIKRAPYQWGTGSASPNELNGVSPGTYIIKVEVIDDEGGISSDSFRLTVKKKPNVLPQVRIISPSKDISVDTGYQLGVKAEASDSDGSIRGVKLYIGSRMIREIKRAPYEWGTGSASPNELNGVSPGTYIIKVEVIDDEGGISSDSFRLTVKKKPNIPPQVQIISPINDLNVETGYQLSVKAEANDSDGSIVGVKLFVDTQMIREIKSAPFEWGVGSSSSNELNGLSNGTYTIKVEARDNKGDTSTDTFTLIVSNKPNVSPQVRIKSPSNNINIIQGDLLKVKAEANDSDGTIKGVKLYINDQLISELNNPPYEWESSESVTSPNIFDNLLEGKYVITVVAEDNMGEESKDSIEFTVIAANKGDKNDKEFSAVIYPNPAKEKLVISTNIKSDNIQYQIFDILGRKTMNINLTPNKGKNTHEINISSFSKGMYIFEIFSDGEIIYSIPFLKN